MSDDPFDRWYRLIVETAQEGIWLMDGEGRTLFVNPKVTELLGYASEELLGKPAQEFVSPETVGLVEAGFDARHAGDRGPRTYELRLEHRGGGLVDLQVSSNPIYDNGVYIGSLAMLTDVTERRRIERELAESERRFRAVFDNSLAAMAIIDDHRRYVDANEAACEVYGIPRDEIVGRTIVEVSADPERADEAWAAFKRGGSLSGSYELRRPDGGVRVIDFTATANIQPGRHLAVFFDMTGPRRLEEQLQQAQKMEAVGQLAGGVAHDFNNQLGAIRLTAELALTHLDDAERLRRELERIVGVTHSGSVLTRQLLAFSRHHLVSPRSFDLNGAVRDAEELLRRLIGEHILLEDELHAEPLYVEVDPAQLEQALINLAVNARDAMPAGGRLLLATRPDGESAATVVVEDTGVGMDDALLERIFEPFFTTKPMGEGTGLGLALVYAFAQQWGGSLRVESAPEQGSTFTIVLPRAQPPEPASAPEPAQVQRGTESILLVEDEPDVRRVVEAMLAACGYRVVAAESPEAALEHAAARDAPLDVLLTDVLMPKMTGTELARRVRELRPDAGVVFMSGYAADAVGDTPLEGVFLAKPFGAVELTAAVRRSLAG